MHMNKQAYESKWVWPLLIEKNVRSVKFYGEGVNWKCELIVDFYISYF